MISARLPMTALFLLSMAACGAETTGTPEPDTVIEPDISTAPDTGDEPDITPEPDVTPEPDIAPEPDIIIEPDVAPEPDIVPEPDIIPEPDITPDPDADDDVADVDPTTLPCDPPLALASSEGWVLPYGLLTLQASGGTGAYRFALVDPDSTALLNALSGSYLASGDVGATDVVWLTDDGCVGQDEGTVHVVDYLEVTPMQVEVDLGQELTFLASGGSPDHLFEVVHAPSGGAITPEGVYTAGGVATTDQLRCVDQHTGQAVELIVTVSESPVLWPRPSVIALPLDATFDVHIEGGSGVFELNAQDETVLVTDTTLTGEAPGATVVDITDSFTGQTAQVHVTVMGPFQLELERGGDASYEGILLGPGDIDGDGYRDAVFALREADITAVDSGAVYIYAGGPDGLGVDPVRIISMDGRRQHFGRGMTIADLDADGLDDLIVGANGYDAGLVDNGAVFIYRGVEGAFFEATPSMELPGLFGYDHHGFAITACDFNGDDHLDLAVNASYGEDRDVDDFPAGQGAVHIYLGGEDGLPLEPNDSIYGMVPNAEGEWVGVASLRMGEQLASGDVDGDELCDLIVGTLRYNAGIGGSNDGFVAIYKGRAASAESPGGVEPLPSRIIAEQGPGNPSSHVGRRVAAGDIDGDGLADVGFTQYLHDDPAQSGTNHGAMRVLLGGPLPTEPPTAFESPSVADIVRLGDNGGDGFGWFVGITDVDGVPPLDLVAGSTGGEDADGPNGTGHVEIFLGVQGGLPSETADRILGGEANGDIFGMAITGLGDVDGDDLGDLMVVAGRNDELGEDVGRPYFVSGDPEVPMAKLDLPGEAAGSAFGQSVALIDDLNGDGHPEALVGAPNLDLADIAINVGDVALYLGTDGGFEPLPYQRLHGYQGQSNGDRFGLSAQAAQDFDGDGRTDIAVLARYDDRPSNYPGAWHPDSTCSGTYNNGGAVMVFSTVSCGDGACAPDETCENCEADCGACPDVFVPDPEAVAPLVASQPRFIWYGAQVGQTMRGMLAGIDINGDGLGDFVAGGLDWDRPGAAGAGGFSVVFGRPAEVDGVSIPEGDTLEICAADWTYVGLRTSDYVFGWQGVTSVGYLNDDSCEDFAVGAYVEDFDNSSQGTVRVFFGWGGVDCPEAPTYVHLAPLLNGGQSGFSVDGGLDATGDGIPDLLIGGHRLTIDGDAVGAAWLVDGDYIRQLPPELVVDGADPDTLHPYIPSNAGLSGVWRVEGSDDDEWFGADVALVPKLSGDGRAGLAIGGPFGSTSGSARSGGVRLYRVHEGLGGIDLEPLALVGGETWRADSQLGYRVDTIATPNGAQLLIGGHEGSSLGLDQGSVYSFEVAPLQ